LLARAHGGVLYVDEVNLLADHLADALLDAAASGVLVVEREGFSVSQPAEFVLLGSMNPEEGSLRPQLLDRFALVVDVEAPMDPALRAEVLARRLSYDADPAGFAARWREAQSEAATRLAAARRVAAEIALTPDMLRHVASRIAQHNVRSLRADLAVVRASRAFAALQGATEVTPEHVDVVLPLALVHRMPQGHRPPSSTPPPPSTDPRDEPANAPPADGEGVDERVFPAAPQPGLRLVVEGATSKAGAAVTAGGPLVGPAVRARQTDEPRELDVRASVVHALGRTGSARVEVADLHDRVRTPRSATRFILLVDSSGSHAVAERMRLVKGVASGLLDASHGRHDEIVVIGCRGPQAEVLVEPTSSRDDAARALEYLPTGGRTPLAHGFELAAGYVTDQTVLIVITDGRANVPLRSDDPWADARHAAASIRCAALVIDTENGRSATGRPRELAEAMRAKYVRLEELKPSQVLTIVQGNG